MTDPRLPIEPGMHSVGASVRSIVRSLLDAAREGRPIDQVPVLEYLDAERAAGRIPSEAPTVAVAEYLAGASLARGLRPGEVRASDERAFVERTAAASLVLLGLEAA